MTPADQTRPCTLVDARKRLAHARAFLDQADLAGGNDPEPERAAAASSAVLAGIAAADATCCAVLGMKNHLDHQGAVSLLKTVRGANQAANALNRLLNLKGQVQYVGETSAADLRTSQRAARTLVTFAEHSVGQ